MMNQTLPRGFNLRPARLSDCEALVQMFNANSQRLYGVSDSDVDGLATEWREPGFDLERDTRVVLDPSSALVGYADLWDTVPPHVRIWAWGCVAPDERGKGIGSALVAWQDERGREAFTKAPPGTRICVRQGVASHDQPALRLLESSGYTAIRHNFRMLIELDKPVPAPVWPDGVAVRTFDASRDLVPMAEATRAAFRDHWGHVESPLESDLAFWRHVIEEEKSFDASLWFLAVADGEVAGLALCSAMEPEDPDLGYVNTLGVVRSWRRRGVALALLHHAFTELGVRGKKRVALGVDGMSLTGAVRLYERAGMHVDRRRTLLEKELRPGLDLTTQHLEE